jgi:very-short-patch-repair endonuclease
LIATKLEEVRRRLLDLSRNNRLLNHRATGQRTLQIVDELPGQVYSLLVDDGRTLQFLSLEEAPPEARSVIAADLSLEEGGAPSGRAPGALGESPFPSPGIFPSPGTPGEGQGGGGAEGSPSNTSPPLLVTQPAPHPSPGVPGEGADSHAMSMPPSATTPPEPPALPLAPVADAAPAERHRDSKLQTALEGEKLQTRLVNLAREANSALQEQGCNILYLTFGMIEWRDAESADESSRAPLIFVPVELKRKTVNARYALQMFDDDVVANPSLNELCQTQFNFSLPAFDAEKDDPEQYLQRAQEAIASLPGWKFTPEIHLGLFSFSKLLMYRDLDPRNWPAADHLADHELIQSLTLGTSPEDHDGEGIPDPSKLDEMVDPADCFQVVDADSSQQSAILAAKRGMSLVIDGPPGTGKSQTITNIIAESLAAGKTVLFVSEKSAALEVVKRRLTEAGLGDFVLELHSRQASKRAVLEEINRVLESDVAARPVPLAPAEELRQTRDRLNTYHRDLHTPLGALAISPFEGMSLAIGLADEPEAHCDIPDVMAWSAQHLTEADQHLAGLDRCLARVGDESAHPWRGVWLSSAGLREKQRIKIACDALVHAIGELLDLAGTLASMVGVPAPSTRMSCEEQRDVSGALVNSPASVAEVVCGTAALGCETDSGGRLGGTETPWDNPNAELNDWLQLGVRRQDLKKVWQALFIPSAEEQDWSDLLARRRAQHASFLRFFNPSWYADGRRLKAAMKDTSGGSSFPSPGTPGEGQGGGVSRERRTDTIRQLPATPPPPQPSPGVPGEGASFAGGALSKFSPSRPLEPLAALIESGTLRKRIEKRASNFGPMFGSEWKGIDGDWSALQRFAVSALEIRKLILSQRLDAASALKWLSAPDRAPLASAGNEVQAALNHLADCWREWLESIGSDERRWLASSFNSPSPGTPGEGWGEGDSEFERRSNAQRISSADPAASHAPITLTPALSRGTGRGSSSPEILKSPPKPKANWENADLPALAQRLTELPSQIERLDDWIDLRRCVTECSNTSLRSYVEWALFGDARIARGRLSPVFRRHFYRLWVEETFAQRESLRKFRGQDHESVIQKFRDLDRQWIQLTRERLADKLASRRQGTQQPAHRLSKLGMLQAEIRKKSRHMPLRKLLAAAGEVVQSIKPCFMMSPLSVAQYLAPGGVTFDLVVFDEASQVEPADAYGAIARGRQLLLVGDERQLPPTNFFARNDPEQPQADDDSEVHSTDLESILSLGIVRLPHRCGLRWHYRSRHSSLIEFSNHEFYDDRLRIFPSPHTDCSEMGLAFRYVENSVYLRGAGRFNPIEAKTVAEAVIRHAIETPEQSLGVGTLNQPQQRAIEDEIERLRRAHSDELVEQFFARHAVGDPFFVKNLENIQGDERDVIFLSIGFGKDGNGRLHVAFGALNSEGGWRRLNVLVTRARQRCIVFSSVRADDIDLGATQARGVVALKEYLYAAEQGRLKEAMVPGGDHDSDFEAAVCGSLRDKGWEVHAQVGCAGFAIDLAVVDPRAPGRYLLGIECDGATYHSSPTARDRDRLRQAVLESLGWTIQRIWSTDWFHRPQMTLQAVLTHLEELKKAPLQTRKPPHSHAAVAPESGNETNKLGRSTPSPGTPGEGRGEGDFENQRLSTSENTLTPTLSRNTGRGGKSAPSNSADGDLPPGVIHYRSDRNGKARGTPASLLAMKPEQLAKVLTIIVMTEGPIHVEEVLHVCTEMYGAKASARPREAFERGLDSAIAAGTIPRRGDFLWPAGQTDAQVRYRGGECPVTDAERICPEEFDSAVRLVLQQQFGLPFDALTEATARLMGFSRTGPKLKSAIEQSLVRLDQRQEIQLDNARFVTLKRASC